MNTHPNLEKSSCFPEITIVGSCISAQHSDFGKPKYILNIVSSIKNGSSFLRREINNIGLFIAFMRRELDNVFWVR